MVQETKMSKVLSVVTCQLEVKTTRLKETGSQEKAEQLHIHLALRWEKIQSNLQNAAKPTESSRSWASINKKPSKEDVDLVLIRTANSLVERIKQIPEPENEKESSIMKMKMACSAEVWPENEKSPSEDKIPRKPAD